MMRQVYQVSLIIHQTPKETMTMTRTDLEGIWEEHLDMTMEQKTGHRKPKIYQYEKDAIKKLKEQFNDSRS